MDFDTYKTLICNMYNSETKDLPNYILLKNTYDFIDIRGDGVIDINEWSKTFNYSEVDKLYKIVHVRQETTK